MTPPRSTMSGPPPIDVGPPQPPDTEGHDGGAARTEEWQPARRRTVSSPGPPSSKSSPRAPPAFPQRERAPAQARQTIGHVGATVVQARRWQPSAPSDNSWTGNNAAAAGALGSPNVSMLAPPPTPFTPPGTGAQPRASQVTMQTMLAASKFKAKKGPPKRPDPLRSVPVRETPALTPAGSPSRRADESPGPKSPPGTKLTPGQKTVVRRNDTPVKKDEDVLAEFGGFLEKPLGFFGFTMADKRKAIFTIAFFALFLVILFIVLATRETGDSSSAPSGAPPWPAWPPWPDAPSPPPPPSPPNPPPTSPSPPPPSPPHPPPPPTACGSDGQCLIKGDGTNQCVFSQAGGNDIVCYGSDGNLLVATGSPGNLMCSGLTCYHSPARTSYCMC